jgi:hypothetical protein
MLLNNILTFLNELGLLQGLFNALVYGFTDEVLLLLKQRFNKRDGPAYVTIADPSVT